MLKNCFCVLQSGYMFKYIVLHYFSIGVRRKMATDLLTKAVLLIVCLLLDYAIDGKLDIPFPLRNLTEKEIRLLNWLKKIRRA